MRATVDLNQPLAFGAPGTFLGQRGRAPQRALAGRRHRRPRLRRAREQVDRAVDRVRPQHAHARRASGAVHAPGQPRRLRPARRGVAGRSADADLRARARRRSIRTPTTAAPTTTTTRCEQDSVTAARRARLRAGRSRFATRRATTPPSATAVITVDRQPCRLQPGDQPRHPQPPGQRAAQRHLLQPDQPDRAPDDRPDPPRSERSASRSRARASSRRRSAASARARRSISNNPDVFSPVVGMDIAPTGALAEGSTDTVALYVFDGFDLRAAPALNGGIRVERYETTSHAVAATGVRHRSRRRRHARQRQGRHRLSAQRAGQRLRVVRVVADAAWIGQLPAERRGRQPEQPERRSAEVDQLRSRHEVGPRGEPAAAERRLLLHRERERHLRRRRQRGAADLQSGRRAAREGRGVRHGRPAHAALGREPQSAVPGSRKRRARTRPTTASG